MAAAEKDASDFLDQPIEGRLSERLQALEVRFVELERLIGDPEQQSDRARFQEMLQEHGTAASMVGLYREYCKTNTDLEEARSIIESGEDADLEELAQLELEDLKTRQATQARAVRMKILDQQVEGGDDCIFEVRAGTGGDEAALFVADVFKMYSLYSEKKRWKARIIFNPNRFGSI